MTMILKKLSSNNTHYNAIDLFAGIGGIRIGFENAFNKSISFKMSSEIDKNAQITYQKNFNDTPHGDITKIKEEDIPPHDILLAGFPCQAFSVAGYRKGFEDTRGTLFFDVARIARFHKPSILFLENVKGFVGHDNGNTFKTVIKTLEDLGYHIAHKVLNTMEYSNIPQNRERIYIVAFQDKSVFENFEFPQKVKLENSINDCLEKKIKKKFYYNDKPLYEKIKDDITNKKSIYQWRRQYVRENKSSVCPTLTANMGTGGHNVPIVRDEIGIRKITPRECANFQGFPKDYIIPENDIATSHLYKQFGNSVTVGVVEKIATKIYEALGNS